MLIAVGDAHAAAVIAGIAQSPIHAAWFRQSLTALPRRQACSSLFVSRFHAGPYSLLLGTDRPETDFQKSQDNRQRLRSVTPLSVPVPAARLPFNGGGSSRSISNIAARCLSSRMGSVTCTS